MAARVVIIGCGKMGHTHADAFRRAGATLAGACDPSDEARDAFHKAAGVDVYPSVEELLDRASPHAAVVCTPPANRITAVAACLDRGVAVLCEKPLAAHLADAVDLHSLAGSSPAVTAVAFCHRYAGAMR